MPPTSLDLPTAAQEIVHATVRRNSRDGKAPPFFFIIGAGVSAPYIPLASGIERLCRDEIARHGLQAPPEGGKPMDRYEASFSLAFPQAEDRRAFLHERIHKAPISPANFRLAHLLGRLGRYQEAVFAHDEVLARFGTATKSAYSSSSSPKIPANEISTSPNGSARTLSSRSPDSAKR